MKDRVIFRQDKDFGTVMAFLPDNPVTMGFICCYQHIGQHTEAHISYYNEYTTPCYDLKARQELLEELKGLGYDLRVVQRLHNTTKTRLLKLKS